MLFVDLFKIGHLLIVGDVGSGKSNFIHSLIFYLLSAKSEAVQFIMVNPKFIEFSRYDSLPNIMTSVKNDSASCLGILERLFDEMQKRFEALMNNKMRSIIEYNEQVENSRMRHIIFIIDEFSDAMLSNPHLFESTVDSLVQLSNIVGIHIVDCQVKLTHFFI